MVFLLPAIALFVFCFYSFEKEVRLEKRTFAERKKMDNQHILEEVDRFLKERTQDV